MSDEEQSYQYEMTFTPNTIEHLGVRMYSTVPPVLAELIANSYDADAKKIDVHLVDEGEKQIVITDDGHGMTSDEINSKFLRIGRNRRDEETTQLSPGGRKVIGKKGVGKLSFFGVAHKITVSTTKNNLRNTFVLEWDAILQHDENEDPTKQTNYHPKVVEYNVSTDDSNGTVITLESIQRESEFDAEAIADSLSKIFIVDKDFNINVSRNSEPAIIIDNSRKYNSLNIEIEWKVPENIEPNEYLLEKGIVGYLIATEKPISPKTNMRGITLFSRKKLVQAPDYFSESTSSHFYSYLTGYLEVDFIDDLDDDVIGTNRQSLDWKHPDTEKLQEELRTVISWLERDWRKKRSDKRKKKLTEATGIQIEDWLDTMPTDISAKVQPIIQALVDDAELPEEATQKAVRDFHVLIPEYPTYHWRHLHPEVQAVSKTYYQNGDYYTAFLEGAKRFIAATKDKAEITEEMDDGPMMESVFKMGAPILSVTEIYKRGDGKEFEARTIKNIRNAQARLSSGVVYGGRNVVAHEEVVELRNSGLFSESDCLDMLSLISHLYYRLEKSVKL